ncbi:MAG: glutamate--tRNA ligase [Calditrichaeota bacterium]|nr:MAG: glutamate--tRNA ligase [Calditrichota bacterium]
MHSEIRTRFAPSPTGYLHVGGARTALFNWLFARKHQGKFLLRIEDTDRERSSDEMTRQIFDGLVWLGLLWDEEVIYQGARAQLHREKARELVRAGKAYPCFCSKEELEAKRLEAQRAKRAYRYDGTCRNLSPQEVQEKIKQGLPYAIRFKVPLGATSWEDAVHGTIRVQHEELDDFIILRSDGSPVYHLAVVVDDHWMRITHVIRGDDHISNTPKQILLYQAFGWQVPIFAHVPLILGPDRKRLSKRHGATSVEEYRQQGILPEALFNYLALLGWSPGDNRELMSREEIIAAFSLEGISKNNAVFDEAKLVWMNSQYISRSSEEYLWSRIADLLVERGVMTQTQVIEQKPYLLKVIALIKTRVKRLTDFVDQALYFYRDPETYDQKGLRKHLKREEIWAYLSEATERLSELETFSETEIERVIRQLAEEKGISAAKLIHPIRLALTGVTVSPGLFELMSVLGRETVLRRLNRFLEQKPQLMESLAQDGANTSL